jgi:hypothetical protein
MEIDENEIKELRNAYAKEWRKNNPEKVKATNAKFYAKKKFEKEQEKLKQKMKIDEEIKNKINHLASVIVQNLKNNSSVFMNLQIEEEYSQYDVLFSYNFVDYGRHQRGITKNNLLISVIGFGSYGFSIAIPDTDPGYYKEKLGVSSNFLSFLFNEVRKKLYEKS